MSGARIPKKAGIPKRMQFGSAGSDLNHRPEEQCYRPDKRKVRNARNVRDDSRGNRLGTKQEAWNVSSKVYENDNHYHINRIRVNSENDRPATSASDGNYRYNYRAEKLPPKNKPHRHPENGCGTAKFKVRAPQSSMETNPPGFDDRVWNGHQQRCGELPNHPDLVGKLAWGMGTKLTGVEKQNRDDRTLRACKRNTRRKNKELNSHSGPVKNYRSHRDKVRRAKALQEREWDPNEPVHDSDGPRRYNRNAIEPDVYAARTNVHTGTWGANGANKEIMWSDTGAEYMEAPGDVRRTRRADLSNLYAHVEKRHECHPAVGRERRLDKRERRHASGRSNAQQRPKSAHC
jgi:hypothetical protein